MANLNERELYKAFSIGVNTAIAGACISGLALLAKFVNLEHILLIGLWICLAGFCVAASAVALSLMNDFFALFPPEIIKCKQPLPKGEGLQPSSK